MLTLKEYLELADRVLKKYGRFVPSEEDISFVAEYMMRADNRYIEGIGDRKAFRIVNGKYAIRTLVSIKKKSIKKQEKVKIESLDFDMSNIDLVKNIENIPDKKQKTPNFYFEHNELINYIKKTNKLKDIQKEVIIDFINSNCRKNKTPDKDFNISANEYNTILKNSLKKIRYYFT